MNLPTTLVSRCLLALCTAISAWGQGAADALLEGFQDPPAQARPDAFWAWLNGHADLERITFEMEAFRAAGFSQLQVWDVRAHRDPEGIVPVGPAFLSDEWLVPFAHTNREAQRLGLKLGLVAASGWNAGGTWVSPERAGLSLFSSVQVVSSSGRVQVQLAFPDLPEHSPRAADGRPAYWATVAVHAAPVSNGREFDVDLVRDLTGSLDASGQLTAELPPGEWDVRWFVRANSGQRLIVPSPHSDGLQIDFFDAEDSRWYFEYVLDRLESALGPLGDSALRYLEVDSLELEGGRLAAWTEEILGAFEGRYGYDAAPWLTLLVQPERAGDLGARFLHDWSRLVSDLMIDNHYAVGNRILKERGLLLSAEAGGPGPPIWSSCPVDALGALGATGLVRGEFWPKQRSMYNVKQIACAAHTYGFPVVDAEAFTSWRHWRDLPYYLKQLADQAFVDGLNHITFHTAPHGGGELGLPGFAYHAGTHIGPNVAWWPMARPFIDYLSRTSFLLQQGQAVADVCFYQGDAAPNFHPLSVDWDPRVRPMGFDYDVVDVRQLVGAMKFEDGRLRLPSGASYSVLVLPGQDSIDVEALQKITELASAGATVIGPGPVRASGLQDRSASDALVRTLGTHLVDRGFLHPSEELERLLSESVPDFTWKGGDARTTLDFVHRRSEAAEIYFVVNRQERWESVEALFRVQGRFPEVWDPVSGEAEPLAWQHVGGEQTQVPLLLPPGGSRFVVFRGAPEAGAPPAGQAQAEGIQRALGAGVDKANGDTPNGPAWVSSGEAEPSAEWIVYDLGASVELHFADVWNYQHQTRGLLTRGIRELDLSTSATGRDFGPAKRLELRKSPSIGERGYQQRITLDQPSARFVRIAVVSNHSDDWSGHTRIVALSKIAFFSADGSPIPGVRVQAVSSGVAHDPATDGLRATPTAGVALTGPWTVRFPAGLGAPEQVTLETLVSLSSFEDPGVRYFSGIAEYSTEFTVAAEQLVSGAPMEIDLGRLAGVARVYLNGFELGVSWLPPYTLAANGLLKPGGNTLRCEVANTWHNRLVGDASLEPADRTTTTNIRGPFTAETPLLESGLLGPVRWGAAVGGGMR